VDEHEEGKRGGRVVAIALAVALVAGGTALAVSSLDDVPSRTRTSEPPEAAASPAPSPSPSSSGGEPALVIPPDAQTVYDASGEVRDCATSSRRFPAAGTEAGFADDVRRISRSVERIRELRFRRPVETRVVPAEEVGLRFASGIARRYSPLDAEADRRWMSALRLVPEEIDLRTLSVDVARETAAGFYSPRKKRLFSRSTGGVLTPFDEVVLAHEIDHALVDQALRLPGTLSNDPMLADVMLAHQALVEGDATLAMTQYGAGTLDRDALATFLRRFSNPEITAVPGVPWYLQRTSGFPYYEGLLFACESWRDWGWNEIDRMYRHPPASTAEILFPWRYSEAAAGELPPAAPRPGRKWKELTTAAFGALDLMLMLENADLLATGRATPGSRVDEVRGWNGGVLNVWFRGAATAVHISLLDAGVTKNGRTRRKLCGALRGWRARTYPEGREVARDLWAFDGGVAGLRCAGASVELAVAPEPGLVRKVLAP
jgi:hypothetical protein